MTCLRDQIEAAINNCELRGNHRASLHSELPFTSLVTFVFSILTFSLFVVSISGTGLLEDADHEGLNELQYKITFK